MERIGEGELVVMEALWADSPLTASEVAERIPPERGWSDRTVKTMLARLLAKGVLAHEEDARRYLYRPLVERADYVQAESQGLLDRLFEGQLTPLISHFAQYRKLKPEELAKLKRLIDEVEDDG